MKHLLLSVVVLGSCFGAFFYTWIVLDWSFFESLLLQTVVAATFQALSVAVACVTYHTQTYDEFNTTMFLAIPQIAGAAFAVAVFIASGSAFVAFILGGLSQGLVAWKLL